MAVLQVQTQVAGELLAGYHCFDSGEFLSLADIDRFNQGMRVRAAFDARVQQARTELKIIREDRRPGGFLLSIDARHAVADWTGAFFV